METNEEIEMKDQEHYDVYNAIENITELKDLDKIWNLIKSKRKRLSFDSIYALKDGDKVRIVGSNKIEKGIFKKANRSKAIIDIDGKHWTVPFEMIRSNPDE